MSESSLARSLFSGKEPAKAKKQTLRKKSAKKAPKNPQNVVEGSAQEPNPRSKNVSAQQPDAANSLDGLDQAKSKEQVNQNLIVDADQSIDRDQVEQVRDPKAELELELKVMREEITMMRSHYENEFKQKDEYIAQLEAEIIKLEQNLAGLGTDGNYTQGSIAAQQAEQIQTLEQQNQELNSCLDLIKANNDELSAKFNQQFATLTVLQQSLADSEQNSKRSQARVVELEERVAELQEQVLKQAGKASEYEAAIQHWKEQSLNHQRRALHLSGALEKLLDQKDQQKQHPRAGLPASASIPRPITPQAVRAVAKVAPVPEQEFTRFEQQAQPSSQLDQTSPTYRPLEPYQPRNQSDHRNGNNGSDGSDRVPAAVGASNGVEAQAQKQTRKVDLPSFLIRNR
ncbi:hypothetical protein Pse7367_3612 [Thalassoporum mexicanum PCC 7367]|uniref:hypothetical protein n=1 Tax=Thalassoporum mexicanum TaxID=3457544 RepID=UPI00029FCCF3|nr:hypothetical protein [Pseudanabaena sp. PCC 7367]AFY71845.1 hypothetical protein Pse7367_3612 [Pseudanabaena sp. PCC 7367]